MCEGEVEENIAKTRWTLETSTLSLLIKIKLVWVKLPPVLCKEQEEISAPASIADIGSFLEKWRWEPWASSAITNMFLLWASSTIVLISEAIPKYVGLMINIALASKFSSIASTYFSTLTPLAIPEFSSTSGSTKIG